MSDTDEEKPTTVPSRLRTSRNVTVAFKLNGKNYLLWSRLMKVAIGGRRGYSHITDEPPEPNNKGYRDWEETDLVVFSWIIDNIENDIIADFAHHQTTKALWDNLQITFESKVDSYHIYDLEDKVITIRQGNLDLETYYRRIHGLWINVDRSQRQSVTCCDKGIKQFREHTNEKWLFKFLTGLNPEYDGVRRDILKLEPYPSVEEVYGWVKKEAARWKIMPPASSSPTGDTTGVGSADASSGEIGYGFGAQRDRSTNRGGPQRPPPAGATHQTGAKPDKSELWCTHCGKNKHTRESCFLRVGYPERWDERQKARAQAKLAAIGINETGQRQSNAAIQNREGTSGGGNQPNNTPHSEIGGGGGGVSGVRVGNLVERTESAEPQNWGGGAYFGGKGFDSKSNPQIFGHLQFNPHIPHILCMTPHSLKPIPPYLLKCDKSRQTSPKLGLTPNVDQIKTHNRFTPL